MMEVYNELDLFQIIKLENVILILIDNLIMENNIMIYGNEINYNLSFFIEVINSVNIMEYMNFIILEMMYLQIINVNI